MNYAEIYLFENNPADVKDVVDAFKPTTHSLKADHIGTTLTRALDIVEGIEVIENKPIVVFLDGNLSEDYINLSGSDAITIYHKMKRLNLFDSKGIFGVKIIDFSSSSLVDVGLRVHAAPGKGNPAALPRIIDNLQLTSSWMKRV